MSRLGALVTLAMTAAGLAGLAPAAAAAEQPPTQTWRPDLASGEADRVETGPRLALSTVRHPGGPGRRHDRERACDHGERPVRRAAVAACARPAGYRRLLREGVRTERPVRLGPGVGRRPVEHP